MQGADLIYKVLIMIWIPSTLEIIFPYSFTVTIQVNIFSQGLNIWNET